MDYSVKTLSQLRPVLRGFRKAAGLTQAMLAERLGITQQSYAQFEADPAAAGVERLFTVLRLLNVGITLSQDAPSAVNAAPVAKMAPSNPGASSRPLVQGRGATKAAPRKRTGQPAAGQAVPALKAGKRTPAAAPASSLAPGARKTPRRSADKQAPRATAPPARRASAPKKREPW